MNKLSLNIFATAFIAFVAVSCQKDDSVTSESTFVKSKLTNKEWYTKDSGRHYNFDANGSMKNATGSWKWIGSSDTVHIDWPNPLIDEKIIVNYITDSEMRCRYAFDVAKFETFKCVKW